MKIRIAFYKSQLNKLVDLVISGWTWFKNPNTLRTSHVEIGFPIDNEWIYFSSTNRGDAKGTRWIQDNELLKNPERWEIYEMEKDEEYIKSRIEMAEELCGSGYDWWGIVGFIMPFGKLNSKHKWYCSEVCWYILTANWMKRISPRMMWRKVALELNSDMVI